LTFCTHQRQSIFTTHDNVTRAWSQILRAAQERAFDVIAYCFMPDHVHLVAQGTAEHSDLKRFMSLAKQYSGYEYKRRTDRNLWQPYAYEHVLRHDESLTRAVRYVIENPVRKGLVEHPRDYPFLGSSRYSLQELIDFAYETRPA